MRRGDVIARIADLASFRVDGTVSDIHGGPLTGMPAVVRANDIDLAGTVTEILLHGRKRSPALTVALSRAVARRTAAEPAHRRPGGSPQHKARALRVETAVPRTTPP